MKPIVKKLWTEPAAFIGLATTVVLAVGAAITGSDWSWEAVVAIAAPLLSGLGIRQLVTPAGESPAPTKVDK